MRARGAKHVNDIVSLTVLALMVLALAAAQARSDTRDVREFGTADNGVISLEISFRHNGE